MVLNYQGTNAYEDVAAWLAMKLLLDDNITDFSITVNPNSSQNFDDILVETMDAKGKQEKLAVQLKLSKVDDSFSFLEYKKHYKKDYKFLLFINIDYKRVQTQITPTSSPFLMDNGEKVYQFRPINEKVDDDGFYKNFYIFLEPENKKTRKIIEDWITTRFFAHSKTVKYYIDFFQNLRKNDFEDHIINRDQIILNLTKIFLSDYIIKCQSKKDSKIELIEKSIKLFDVTVLPSIKSNFIAESWTYNMNFGNSDVKQYLIALGRKYKLIIKDKDLKDEELQFELALFNKILFLNLNKASKSAILSLVNYTRSLQGYKLSLVLVGDQIDENFEKVNIFRNLQDLQRSDKTVYKNISKRLNIDEENEILKLTPQMIFQNHLLQLEKPQSQQLQDKPLKSGVINRGYEYEKLVPALLSLQLLTNKTVKDFVFDLNPSSFQKFDNFVLNVTYTDGQKTQFAVQLKHREKGRDILDAQEELFPQSQKSKSKAFAIPEFRQFYSKNEASFPGNCKLVLFTNADFSNIEKVSDFEKVKLSLLTNKTEKTYQFRKKIESGGFYHKFYLIAGQESALEIRRAIENVFINNFDSTLEAATCYIDIFRNVRSGDYRNTEISHHQIVLNIMKLLLSDHIINCTTGEQCSTNQLIEESFKQFDLTILSSTRKSLIRDNWRFSGSVFDLEITELAFEFKLLRKDLEKVPRKDVLEFVFYVKKKLLFLELNEKSKQSIIALVPLIVNLHSFSLVLVGENNESFRDFKIFRRLKDLQQFGDLYQEIKGKLKFSQNVEEMGTPDELFQFFKEDLLDGSFNHTTNDFVNGLELEKQLEGSTLTQRYKKFVNEKLKHSLKGVTCSTFSQILRNFYWKGFQHTAIATCLDKDLLESLINVDIDTNFVTIIKERNDFSDIIKVSDDQLFFSDQKLAEFFTAMWLIDNLHRVPEEKKNFLFQAEYTEVRRFFDYALAEDHPLHLAVLNNDKSKVKEKVQKLYEQDLGKRTALHLAVSLGRKHDITKARGVRENFSEQEEILEILLNEIRNNNLPGKDGVFGWDLFEYADASLCLFSLEQLSKIQNIPWLNLKTFSKEEISMSYHCVVNGYITLLKSLSTEKSLRDLDSLHDESLLHVAIKQNQQEVAVLLLLRGVDATRRDFEQRTVLHLAAIHGHDDVAKLLIKKSLNDQDNLGKTALHYASRAGHLTIVQTLVEEGADVNSTDSYQKTPLHEAAHTGETKIVEYLVRKGAKIEIKDKYNKTALDYAEGHENVKKLFQNVVDSRDVEKRPQTIFDAARHGNTDVITDFVNSGVDLNCVISNNKSLLHVAVQNGQKEIINILVSARIDVTKKTSAGKTCLHLGVDRKRSADIVTLLLDYCKNIIDEVDFDGNTALHLAASGTDLKTVKALLDAGADVDIQNGLDQTAEDVAKFMKQGDIIACFAK